MSTLCLFRRGTLDTKAPILCNERVAVNTIDLSALGVLTES